MIGITEIIFSFIIFCVIWFLVFKFKLIYDEKSKLRNINERLEKQDIKVPELLLDIKGHNKEVANKIQEEKEKKEAAIKEKKAAKKPGFLGKLNLFKKKGVKKE